MNRMGKIIYWWHLATLQRKQPSTLYELIKVASERSGAISSTSSLLSLSLNYGDIDIDCLNGEISRDCTFDEHESVVRKLRRRSTEIHCEELFATMTMENITDDCCLGLQYPVEIERRRLEGWIQ